MLFALILPLRYLSEKCSSWRLASGDAGFEQIFRCHFANYVNPIKILAEIEDHLHILNTFQEKAIDITDGEPADRLNWRPIISDGAMVTNSIAVLVAHIAEAEQNWIAEVVSGKETHQDRFDEFATVVENSDGLIMKLKTVGEETRELLSDLTNEKLTRSIETYLGIKMVRWAILHLLEHNTLYLGEMQITYQLWEAGLETLIQ